MTATVHPLFSGSAQARGEQPAAPIPSNPLVAELREVALTVLDELVRRMFDSADDVLFEMGKSPPPTTSAAAISTPCACCAWTAAR